MEANMSGEDHVREVMEGLERADASQADAPGERWQSTRRTALAGGAAGLAAFLISSCGGGGGNGASAASGSGASRVFGSQKPLKFAVINHVTTNPFFVPTRYGAQDACTLLGCSFQWTGSQTSNVNEMVNAFNSAISAKVDGIAVPLIDDK